MDWTPHVAAMKVLEAVIRTGSISAAARELGVSQQSVSARVRSFERLLGVELIVRSPSGVVPTFDGEAVLSWAADVLAAVDRFGTAAELLRDSPDRVLRVAASQTVAAHLLPGWVMGLRRQQLASDRTPVQTQLRTGNSAQVVELLHAGEIDLGFIETPVLPQGLGHSTVAVDRLIPVVSPVHPWAGRREVDIAELADTPLVAREEGSGTREAWERAVRLILTRAAVEPCLVLSSTAAVRSAVAEGIAPAMLSELAVADDILLGRIHPLEIQGHAITRPLTALWRGGARDLLGSARELVDAASRASRRAAG
ncbi:hypothetical protein ASD65_14300 [Microbacterium sp. Root61]|uniref:LysR family transcriptional regulator n=1 Tax=Microbacterium sp. Root61 TaxID=1736570 RepID=UPI0006FA8054|nr:LysR family transcriptional regulator [Microbacterium sp. Root61]KRA25460.1 hypothetical protein ASD65_14300 [Microbacterium sp. Root61]